LNVRCLGWTFSIWGVIYFWQAAWLIYAISRIPRKSNEGYLYIRPNTLHYSIFVLYALNMLLNIAWLIIWDREYVGVCDDCQRQEEMMMMILVSSGQHW
jgi:hypothetical protein